jgi:hypothetical protein
MNCTYHEENRLPLLAVSAQLKTGKSPAYIIHGYLALTDHNSLKLVV